jgi:hypothetical protein
VACGSQAISKRKETTEPSTETTVLESITFFESKKDLPAITRQPIYENILKHVMNSDKKLAKVDSTKLGVKVLTLYYGLKNELNDSPHKTEYKLHIRKHDNQVWIEKV